MILGGGAALMMPIEATLFRTIRNRASERGGMNMGREGNTGEAAFTVVMRATSSALWLLAQSEKCPAAAPSSHTNSR